MVARLTIAYRGTGYAGWQRQRNALAVQQVVEQALSDLFGTPVTIQGASRTDAGVHASGQAAHLQLPRDLPLRGLVHGGNHRLPKDIRIMAADRMADGFHARKSALGKVYRYRLVASPVVSPLVSEQVWARKGGLDIETMRRAARVLPGRHDFTAFASAGGSHTDPRRRLFRATVEREGGELRFVFAGDGFLRGMVRALVGTLVEIGAGKRREDDVARLLTGRPRCEAGAAAPAQGLVLHRVVYPPAWRPLPADPP